MSQHILFLTIFDEQNDQEIPARVEAWRDESGEIEIEHVEALEGDRHLTIPLDEDLLVRVTEAIDAARLAEIEENAARAEDFFRAAARGY